MPRGPVQVRKLWRPALALALGVLPSSCGARTGLLSPDDGTAFHGSYGDDGGNDGDGSLLPSKPPRLLAPLSTARVTRRAPTLRWDNPPGIPDATLDLCSDRACTRPIVAPIHVTGSSYTPPEPLPSGVVYWRVHPSTATSLTSPTWQLTVGVTSAPVDASWGTTLDVNGDGYADVAVTAIDSVGKETAFVYFGGAAGLATTPGATLTVPDGPEHEFSQSVASAGDVNGDGFADLVLGATGMTDAYVYLGSATGPDTMPDSTLTYPPGIGGFDWFASVASAGDVNGDGYADLLVLFAENSSGGAGYASVYLGSATGLGTTPATMFSGPGGAAFWLGGATAGDVNGDGYGDVVIGAINRPEAFVYLGGASGLASSPATTLTGPAGSTFGVDVAGAGDVNGDGYADVVVGADGSSMAYVYLGGAAGIDSTPASTLGGGNSSFGSAVASAGDVNGDGYADVVIGAIGGGNAYVYLGSAKGLGAMPATSLAGAQGSNFGDAVASAGDVNGDGYADLVVGAQKAVNVQGLAYVYLGGASGIPSTATVTLTDGTDEDELFGGSVFGATN